MAVKEKIMIDIEANVEEPADYDLILWNDDTTPMDVVIMALMSLKFSPEKAFRCMAKAHTNGKCVVGTYPYETAVNMRDRALKTAHNCGADELKITVEENKYE